MAVRLSIGRNVRWSGGQDWATVTGAPRAVEQGFDVKIDDYRAPGGRVVFAANRQGAIPAGACGEVAGVGAIHSFTEPTAFDVPQGGLTSTNLLRVYDALPVTQAGYAGQGETVVFLEASGFEHSDLNTFARLEKLPGYNLTLVGKNTGGTDETPMASRPFTRSPPGPNSSSST